jgi:hypothetical protein
MARLDFVVYGKAYSGMRAEPDFVIALAGTLESTTSISQKTLQFWRESRPSGCAAGRFKTARQQFEGYFAAIRTAIRIKQVRDQGFEFFNEQLRCIGFRRQPRHVIARGHPNPGFFVPLGAHEINLLHQNRPFSFQSVAAAFQCLTQAPDFPSGKSLGAIMP